MKKVLFFAVAAALFAACSSKDDIASQAPTAPVGTTGDQAVGFDVYTSRSTTRAGAVGELTTAKMKMNPSPFYLAGFGVFGYYTDNNDYDPQSLPNFMYNQQVTWNKTNNYWQYDPIKYWPNEYGTNAISDDADKVTFFAYAPYVDVVPSTGKLSGAADEAKWGITGMSRNSASGDPLIKYITSFEESKMVDLCWGVCDDPVWKVIQGNVQNINDGTKGLPWLNVQRPSEAKTQESATAASKLKFQFKHALTQFNVQIDAYVDGIDATNVLDANSKIYVRSITFTGFATKGALNLNNTESSKALWLDYNGTADLESGEEVTIFDGRKDGKEGASGAVASNEKTLGLNTTLIQDSEWSTSAEGVTNTAKNLFNLTNVGDPVYVIPTGEDVTVTIVYDVETADGNLATYVSDGRTPGSSIENRISKPISFGGLTAFENGKKYTLKLHLGLNSVKFDAEVENWEVAGEGSAELPSNTPQFVATSTPSAQNVTVEAVTNSLDISIVGLNGGEAVTKTFTGAVTGATGDAADVNGTMSSTLTIAANTTFKNVQTTNAVKYTATSGKGVIINLVQLAAPLVLTVTASNDSKDLILGKTATSGWDEIDNDTEHIKVWKNGVQLAKADNATSDGQFQFDATNNKIILGSNAKTGEKYQVYIKAGDAPAETFTVTVPAP